MCIRDRVLAEVKPYEAQFGHSIPVFVAGSVYTGADLAHFTRLGAAGVQLATRFILSLIHICWACPKTGPRWTSTRPVPVFSMAWPWRAGC